MPKDLKAVWSQKKSNLTMASKRVPLFTSLYSSIYVKFSLTASIKLEIITRGII
jgi:hypothetical protein